jgi:hypothetical protein
LSAEFGKVIAASLEWQLAQDCPTGFDSVASLNNVSPSDAKFADASLLDVFAAKNLIGLLSLGR